jgi:tetratricopeptide (TPR) repeat protein
LSFILIVGYQDSLGHFRWNQVTHQKSAYEIFPNLNDIQSEIRRVAFSINDQIRALQNSVEITASRGEVNRLTNLRSCVRSAATIVASASTIIGVETADLDSNFGDCFEFEPSETMLRWMSSSAISGVEEEPTHGQVGDRGLYPPEAPGYNSDSDGDLEAELIQIHINRGKEELTINKFASAERLFRKCLSRIASGGDLSHSQNALRAKILDFLIETCQNQDKYAEVESLLREKLDLWSRNPPEKDILVAQDMFQLSGILIEQRDYQQALLYARQALRTYRKSGADGLSGVGFILFRLETICYLDGDFDEEQAYRLMYLKHCEQTGETPVPPNKPSVVPDLKIPRKAVAPNQTIADVDAELAKGQQPARSSQSDTINLIKQKSDEAEDESEKKEYSISTALQSTPEVVSLYSMEGPSTAINSGIVPSSSISFRHHANETQPKSPVAGRAGHYFYSKSRKKSPRLSPTVTRRRIDNRKPGKD